MLKEISSVFSFLTIIPAHNTTLETVAKYMWLFPVVGLAIGLAVGGFAYGLEFTGLDPLIIALFVMVVIALITGIHHTDGLADFADGLMTKGTKEEKLHAMKDITTGSAGITTIVLYIVGMIISLYLLKGVEIFIAIVLSEVMAKFSMVLMASIGHSAALGSNSPFLSLMKSKKKQAVAAILTLVPLIVLGGGTGLLVFAAGVTLTFFLVAISSRSFGGITGDVFGATNELTRLVSLLILVSL